MANLYSKYFAHLGLLNKFDLVMLKVRYRRDFPRYRVLFEEAGRRYDVDPLFLAAMSYQESHWDPDGHELHRCAGPDDADAGHGGGWSA